MPPAPVPQAEGAPGILDELAFSEEDVASLVVAKRIIVRTVDMRNVVADVAAAVDGVAALAVELGGWMVSTDRMGRVSNISCWRQCYCSGRGPCG